MAKRYLTVYGRNILLSITIVVLIVISTVSKGSTARATAIAAGIVMIYLAFKFIIWLIRMPVKKDRDAIV